MNEQDLKIQKLQIDQSNMAEKFEDLKGTVINGFEKMEVKFDKFIEEADKKYASKLTEKIVYGLVGVVCLSVAGALVALVLK